jgi:hypothetical protein
MLQLRNEHLAISILDPIADRDRLGPRFCTGGYVYQVHEDGSPIFSGPEFPSPFPSVINGQGAPEVFQYTLYHSPEEIPSRRLVIGVGVVENRGGRRAAESHFGSAVEEFATWRVRQECDHCSMETEQSIGEWALALRRTVILRGRGWRSETEIRSTGRAPLPFRWFAHPFFPLNDDLRCGGLPPGHALEENPGFVLDPGGELRMRPEHDWDAGCYTHIRQPRGGAPFSLDLIHPRAGRVRLQADFTPMKIALWANGKTFSPEPFLEKTLAPGDSFGWSLEYLLFPL